MAILMAWRVYVMLTLGTLIVPLNQCLCSLVLIHGFWDNFYRKPGFPIEISGFRFQFCLKPIHWLISSFRGASNVAKEGLSGPSDGWSWTMSWVKIRQQHLSKSMSIPFFHLLKIFEWWIWVEFSESVSITVPGVMLCVFLMPTSTILRLCR